MKAYLWPKRRVTASFGVATLTPWCVGPGSLVEHADAVLYYGKRGGRNRVARYREATPGGSDGGALRR